MYEKYDNVETEIKLLFNGDFVNLLVRPFEVDSTKVILSLAMSKVRNETVLYNKNYRGTL